jgi:hypothetical protein
VNFARFGEANEYLSKKNDYKLGIRILRENKINSENNYSINSTHITLNDSLMYFKDEEIAL